MKVSRVVGSVVVVLVVVGVTVRLRVVRSGAGDAAPKTPAPHRRADEEADMSPSEFLADSEVAVRDPFDSADSADMVQCPAMLWEDSEEDFRCALGDRCEALSLRADPQAYRDAHVNRSQPPYWRRGAEGEAEEYGGEA